MKLIAFVALLILGALFLFFSSIPTQLKPYTYVLKNQHYPQAQLAENAEIVIIGDQMGEKLTNFIPLLQENFSKTFSRPVKVFNWAKEKEGLHRTLSKVKSLKKVPSVFIYLGATQEFLEKKFYLEDYPRIIKNFNHYYNFEIGSRIAEFPILSKYYYFLPRFIELQAFQETHRVLGAKEQLQNNELHIKLFQMELRELATYLINNKSELILLTSPIDFTRAPTQNCKAAMNSKLENELDQIQQIIEKGKIKEGLARLEFIKNKTSANARTHFLYGLNFLNLQRSDIALHALKKANALDCGVQQGWVIFNNIIRSTAKESGLHLIDFNEIVNKELGHQKLFEGKFPKEEFYKKMIIEINNKVMPIL